MQETRPGLDVVHMEEYEKEQVPEFQCLAKCDRRNVQVTDAREYFVGFLCSDEDSPGREFVR